MKLVISFVVGLLFSLGLGIGGMTNTEVVRGFLDIIGNFNPNLMGVMVGAIIVHSTIYHLIKHRSSPLLDTKFYLPTNKKIDYKLLTGSMIFGLGWGWAGICPGPGLVSIVSGKIEIIIFILSMLGGMVTFKLLERFKIIPSK
jgi:uncharacterized membrane protein YedE/YeeE